MRQDAPAFSAAAAILEEGAGDAIAAGEMTRAMGDSLASSETRIVLAAQMARP
jgi:hypothetical protein